MRARAGTFDPRGDSLSSCGERQQRSCQTEGDSKRGRAQVMSRGWGGYIKWASSVVNGCGAFDSAANQRVIYILCLLRDLHIVSYVVHILPCLHISCSYATGGSCLIKFTCRLESLLPQLFLSYWNLTHFPRKRGNSKKAVLPPDQGYPLGVRCRGYAWQDNVGSWLGGFIFLETLHIYFFTFS